MDITVLKIKCESLYLENQELKTTNQNQRDMIKILQDAITSLTKQNQYFKKMTFGIDSLSPIAKALLENEESNRTQPKNGRRYQESIINFALVQQFYSNAGNTL